MRTIKPEDDIQAFKRAGVLALALADIPEAELLKLVKAFDEIEVERPLDLMQHGYIVLLEPGDNVRDLQEVGLHWIEQGSLGSMPDFVEQKLLITVRKSTASASFTTTTT